MHDPGTVRAQTGPATGLIAQLLLLAVLASTAGLGVAGWVAGVAAAVAMAAALGRGLARRPGDRLGPASWVTLARATLAVGVAALAADSFRHDTPVALLVTLAAVALVLDAADGWMARRTGTVTALGARFDGEVDAFLILALSVYVAQAYGAWVLAIGAARYAFLAGEWLLPWMRAPLPPRRWRKVVAAAQGVVLTVAAAEVLPRALTQALLVAALAALAASMGECTWWLWRRRAATRDQVRQGEAGRPERGPLHAGLAVALTIFALLLVWAALVAPNHPSRLNLGAFARLPVELVVVVALAVVLPATPRRVLAVVAGAVLSVLVVVKVLDIGFFTAFDRPFKPVDDSSYVGIGVETLRDAIGRSSADLAVAAAVVLIVALLAVPVLALLRVTRVAAGHRGWVLRAAAALGVVWVALRVVGVPVASSSTAALAVDEVRAVRTGLQDRAALARLIALDRFRDTPGDRLLTGLRGKDVLLVFVESYGRVAVQGSSFSPRVDAVLERGTAQLRAAGFSSRSAFLTSPTFGGLSWLAHSTLQSGLLVDGQRRYDQLVAADRLTLTRAFKRAGWRAVGAMPANRRAWPEGSTFYHYDQIYDRRNLGYRGPGFGLPPMPDQYTLLALRRRELAERHRAPLFAEVDLISSHAPWTRIPRLIPWDDVGDGSIFDRIPAEESTQATLFGDAEAGPRRLRGFDRVRAEHALLVRAALRRRRPRARRPGRPSARDARHRPGRQPRRTDLGHRPRPEGHRSDRRLALAGRHVAEPAGAGLADGRLPRPLPHRVRLLACTMRQDDRAPFDQALRHARKSAYAAGEFVGQESFMTAGEIQALALRAGIGSGVSVLDLCCGVAGPGRFLTRELGCVYLGVDASASAVAVARERAGDLPCRFAIAQVPPLPAGSFDVVLLLETMLAFEDKDALVRDIAVALRAGGRFAFTLEEGPPLTTAERAAMPDADTVWLTPLDELATSLERAGLVVTWQQDRSRPHRAMAQALADAFAADAAEIAAQIGRRALDELLAAHRLWVEWLDVGRVRKLDAGGGAGLGRPRGRHPHLLQHQAQRSQRVPRAALDRAERQAGVVGDLAHRQAAELRHPDHLAVLRREPLERGRHLPAEHRLLQHLPALRLGGGPVTRQPRAPCVGDRAARDLVQPHAHRRPLGVVARRVAPGAQEDLLHDLLGRAAVAEYVEREAVQLAAVPATQRAHRVARLVTAQALDENGVRGGVALPRCGHRIGIRALTGPSSSAVSAAASLDRASGRRTWQGSRDRWPPGAVRSARARCRRSGTARTRRRARRAMPRHLRARCRQRPPTREQTSRGWPPIGWLPLWSRTSRSPHGGVAPGTPGNASRCRRRTGPRRLRHQLLLGARHRADRSRAWPHPESRDRRPSCHRGRHRQPRLAHQGDRWGPHVGGRGCVESSSRTRNPSRTRRPATDC